ncbi:MAG: hypothetical protein H0X65_06205 [Gemmatimonadetes bacterium]|jgi:hypothetical protein|nr:hypothetical protein [Gemmatimonadota bacterium]
MSLADALKGSDSWDNRLCNLIKKYSSSSSPGATFVNEYRAIVSRASEQGSISSEDANLLLKARSLVELWSGTPAPDLKAAWEQWLSLYETGKDRLPASVLECFLRRLPRGETKGIDWAAFLLGCSEKWVIEGVLRLLKPADVNRIAKAKPTEFYRSTLFDVVLERPAYKCPPPLWKEMGRGHARPADLRPAEEVVVRCYTANRKEGDKHLLATLAQTPDLRKPVLAELLEDHDAASRFCRFLVFDAPAPGSRGRKGKAHPVKDVLRDWMEVCENALGREDPTRRTAALVFALIRLSPLAARNGKSGRQEAPDTALAARTSERKILQALRSAEQQGASSGGDDALVVHGDELFRAVQEYLRGLPAGSRSGQDSPQRALRYERYMGRKEVVLQLLAALEECPGDSQLHDELEVVLFNSGVRMLGSEGEETEFDVHAHQPEASGILPGDRVRITRPGRALGEGEEQVVLVKAGVLPA